MSPSDRKRARQEEFLRVLSETGSTVQARRGAGVTGVAVRAWMADPDFLDRYNDCVETAQDSIRAKVREMALAGDGPMLALAFKAITPSLQARAPQLAVGVKVEGGPRPKLDDVQIVERFNALMLAVEARRKAAALQAPDVVDAEAVEAVDAEVVPDIEDLL